MNRNAPETGVFPAQAGMNRQLSVRVLQAGMNREHNVFPAQAGMNPEEDRAKARVFCRACSPHRRG